MTQQTLSRYTSFGNNLTTWELVTPEILKEYNTSTLLYNKIKNDFYTDTVYVPLSQFVSDSSRCYFYYKENATTGMSFSFPACPKAITLHPIASVAKYPMFYYLINLINNITKLNYEIYMIYDGWESYGGYENRLGKMYRGPKSIFTINEEFTLDITSFLDYENIKTDDFTLNISSAYKISGYSCNYAAFKKFILHF